MAYDVGYVCTWGPCQDDQWLWCELKQRADLAQKQGNKSVQTRSISLLDTSWNTWWYSNVSVFGGVRFLGRTDGVSNIRHIVALANPIIELFFLVKREFETPRARLAWGGRHVVTFRQQRSKPVKQSNPYAQWLVSQENGSVTGCSIWYKRKNWQQLTILLVWSSDDYAAMILKVLETWNSFKTKQTWHFDMFDMGMGQKLAMSICIGRNSSARSQIVKLPASLSSFQPIGFKGAAKSNQHGISTVHIHY